MTRHDKLYSMKMADLAEVAENLGIKIDKKGAKSAAVEKILAAEEMNKQNEKELKKEAAKNDAYVTEIMQQKKDLGIKVEPIDTSAVTIEEVICTVNGIELEPLDTSGTTLDEVICAVDNIDNILLSKFTKKEQKAIKMLYKGEDKLYHVLVDHNNHVARFDDKSLLRIGLAIRAIVKGE